MAVAGQGPAIPRALRDPIQNRGVAFTPAEREALGLVGRLPAGVLTLDEQARRAYQQLSREVSDLAKNVYLEQLHDRNETLYYRLITEHLEELLPIIYSPTIADAIEHYSREYRRPRGIFLSINRPGDIERSFSSLGLGPEDVDLLVCTDAESILGIGDWGVGGIQVAIGKLSVYTVGAGIDPCRTIPVSLDVGTNNRELLDDPLYLGNRHERRRGPEYDAFIRAFVETAARMFPHAILHFEDFGPDNARRILAEYSGTHRVFNDDIQGAGAITLAAVISAVHVTGIPMREQRLVVFGAGSAGVGIADQVRDAMVRDGLSEEEANAQVWLVDKQGLLFDTMPDLRDYQRPYARRAAEMPAGTGGPVSLLETIVQVAPTILVGLSTATGAFTEEVVEAMCAKVERPIIFPLSNPTSRIEAMPADLVAWSKGRALIATGIPCGPVEYGGVTYRIGQANNALLYPGLGLGTIVSGARHITKGMLLAAAEAVASQVDSSSPGASLLPPVSGLRHSSALTAAAVALAAVEEGVATRSFEDPLAAVCAAMWEPIYRPLV